MQIFGLADEQSQLTLYFNLPRHRDMTVQANEGRLSKLDLATVVLANWAQDANQGESRFHVDNCAIPDSFAYYQECWTELQAVAGANRKDALVRFGRILHVVQDFYSHTNWVELNAARAPLPVCDFGSLASLPSELVSGTYSPGEPKRCAAGTPTHDALNKDEPDSPAGRTVIAEGPNQGRTLYELAYQTALQHSRLEFGRLISLL